MDSSSTWTVVKFIDDCSVAAVPTCWIQNEFCLWPPYSAEKLNAAIKNQKFDTCWPTHRVQVFRGATYDSYDIARKKARKAEITSDLNTTDTEQESYKRRITKRKVFSSSDSGEESDENTHRGKKSIRMPTPIKKSVTLKSAITNSEMPRSQPSTVSQTSVTENEPSANLNELDIISIKTKTSSAIPNPNINLSTSTPKTKDAPTCQCYCPKHVGVNNEVLRQLYFIRSLAADIMSEMSNLRNNCKEIDIITPSIQTEFETPIKTEEELQRLENHLKNPDNSKKLEAELCTWGGQNISDFIRRCLGNLISNELAVQYSWLGRRQKRPFYKFEVAQTIMNAAIKIGKARDKEKLKYK